MAQTVHLNGGPWHGRTTTVPDGRDHFHIIEPVEDAVARALEASSPEEGFTTVQSREGMYSQVRGVRGEFEWDGWRSHD